VPPAEGNRPSSGRRRPGEEAGADSETGDEERGDEGEEADSGTGEVTAEEGGTKGSLDCVCTKY
jgi:hypothetical protein